MNPKNLLRMISVLQRRKRTRENTRQQRTASTAHSSRKMYKATPANSNQSTKATTRPGKSTQSKTSKKQPTQRTAAPSPHGQKSQGHIPTQEWAGSKPQPPQQPCPSGRGPSMTHKQPAAALSSPPDQRVPSAEKQSASICQHRRACTQPSHKTPRTSRETSSPSLQLSRRIGDAESTIDDRIRKPEPRTYMCKRDHTLPWMLASAAATLLAAAALLAA